MNKIQEPKFCDQKYQDNLLITFTRYTLLGFFEKILCINYTRFIFKKIVISGFVDD